VITVGVKILGDGERVIIFLHDLNVCDKRCVCLDCDKVFYS
jgi:hypothetical protein